MTALLGMSASAADSPEDVFWNSVRKSDILEEYEVYVQTFPKGKYLSDAKQRMVVLRARGPGVVESRSETKQLELQEQEARDKQAAEAIGRQAAEAEDWRQVQTTTDSRVVEEFIKRYPSSQFFSNALVKHSELKRAEDLKKIDADKKRPGIVFKDCKDCPEMVILPRGRFLMGSPESEPAREEDEGPQREVTINYDLAVGKFEVTFDEWSVCSNDRSDDCRWYDPPDGGWGRGRQPVINVSWDHAQGYVTWLAKKTGKPYRLLSEAEWEYAARATTSTAYYSGNCVAADQANFAPNLVQGFAQSLLSVATKQKTKSPCPGKSMTLLGHPEPIGRYTPNIFGLYDMMGNVAEWVQDCWEKNYSSAPINGGAYNPKGCFQKIRRGGAWSDDLDKLRSAARSYSVPLMTPFSPSVGFRVALPL